MSRSRVVFVLALIGTLGSFARFSGVDGARADVPSPQASYADPCLVACPAGDSVYVVIARRADGRPYEVGQTRIHLCECPDLVLAPVPPGGPYTVDGCRVRKDTWPDGVTSFPLAAGGLCGGVSILVECDGFIFETLTGVASFDQTGDLVVGAADLSLVEAKIGTADPTADFDCDGTVTVADRSIAEGHLGHYHSSIVGVGDDPSLQFAVRPAPNPSHGPMEFLLRTPSGGRATLAVHDVAGRWVADVLDRHVGPGVHRVPWLGQDDSGRLLAPGLYLYRLRLDGRELRGVLIVTR